MQVNYTDIVLFETFDRDQKFILQKCGIDQIVKAEKKNLNGSPRSSTSFVQKYVDQLSDDLFLKIIDIYFFDFKVFNYPIPTKRKIN